MVNFFMTGYYRFRFGFRSKLWFWFTMLTFSINRKSKLNYKNKILIYKNIFQPIILYAAPVWGTCSNCHIKKVQITQDRCLKIVLNKPHYYSTKRLHHHAKIKLVKDSITKQTQSFLTKCVSSMNPLIPNLPN